MYKLKKNKLKAKRSDPDFIVKDEALHEVGEGRKKITKKGEKQILITMKENKNEQTTVDKGKLPTEHNHKPHEPLFKIR